jgi:hypothetical protein
MLYHFSEEPDIKRFEPRPPPSGQDMADCVWAIHEDHAVQRVTPSLIDLWQRVIASTLDFSGTRLRNAQGYERIAHL